MSSGSGRAFVGTGVTGSQAGCSFIDRPEGYHRSTAEPCGDLHVWGIVLAGGSGERLQSFLRRTGHPHPIKQFCAVVGRRTMLQHTWDRVEMLVPRERVVTVIDATHVGPHREHFKQRPDGTVIHQPLNCETGPGTLLPLAHILRRDPEAIVALLPSDHFVGDDARFMAHVEIAVWVVRRGMWDAVILGVEATAPDPDYGWIEVCRAGHHATSRLLPVARFWEKPPALIARALYEGGHLWSTMVTVARGAVLWDLFRSAQPEIHERFERIRSALGRPFEAATIRGAYAGMPSASLSRDVFERFPSCLGAIPVRNVHWSDWGREERVMETLTRIGKPLPSTTASVDSRTFRQACENLSNEADHAQSRRAKAGRARKAIGQ